MSRGLSVRDYVSGYQVSVDQVSRYHCIQSNDSSTIKNIKEFSNANYKSSIILVILVVADRLHLLPYQRHRPGKERFAHFNPLVSRR